MPDFEINTRMKNRSFDAAVRRLVVMNEKQPGRWHLGISTNKYIILEGEESDGMTESKAICVGKTLKTIMSNIVDSCNVIIIKTNNGYHIACNGYIDNENVWKGIYRLFIDMAELDHKVVPIDILHAKLSVKYGNTTIRISRQKPDEIYKVIEVL